MKTQTRHLDRQLQHSHELMCSRRNKLDRARTKLAYIVGGLIIGGWLFFVGACYVYSLWKL